MVVWKFLSSLVGVIQEAIQSGDMTTRLALLLCLVIFMLWALTKFKK